MKRKAQNLIVVSIMIFIGTSIIFAVLLFTASGLQDHLTRAS